MAALEPKTVVAIVVAAGVSVSAYLAASVLRRSYVYLPENIQ